MALISANKRSIASVITRSAVEGYALSPQHFSKLSESYPSFRVWLESVARLRLANTAAGSQLVQPEGAANHRNHSAPPDASSRHHFEGGAAGAARIQRVGTTVDLQARCDRHVTVNSHTYQM